MSNAVFPALTGLSYPVEKIPTWSTKVQSAVSGKETRLNLWSYPIWQYSLNYDVLRSDNVNLELQQLAGFFNARQGSYDDWLFLDPDDYQAAAMYFATGDGTTRVFQLGRTFGGVSEPVRAVNTITQVTINGTPTAGYSINANTGVITFTVAPNAGTALAWSGTYYWRCRFLSDQLTLTKFMDKFWETKTLKFQSCK